MLVLVDLLPLIGIEVIILVAWVSRQSDVGTAINAYLRPHCVLLVPAASLLSTTATSTTGICPPSSTAAAVATDSGDIAISISLRFVGIVSALHVVAYLAHGNFEVILQGFISDDVGLARFQMPLLDSLEEMSDLIVLSKGVDDLPKSGCMFGQGGSLVVCHKVTVHIVIQSEITVITFVSQAGDLPHVCIRPVKNNIGSEKSVIDP
jgi:hypothetical protein